MKYSLYLCSVIGKGETLKYSLQDNHIAKC